MGNEDVLQILEERFGRPYARHRQQMEKDHEAQVFGQGINFFHFENLRPSQIMIRAGLMLTGLYHRGLRNAAEVHLRHNWIHSPDLPEAFDGLPSFS